MTSNRQAALAALLTENETATLAGSEPDMPDLVTLLFGVWTRWTAARALLEAGEVDAAAERLEGARDMLDAIDTRYLRSVGALMSVQRSQYGMTGQEIGHAAALLRSTFGIGSERAFEILTAEVSA